MCDRQYSPIVYGVLCYEEQGGAQDDMTSSVVNLQRTLKFTHQITNAEEQGSTECCVEEEVLRATQKPSPVPHSFQKLPWSRKEGTLWCLYPPTVAETSKTRLSSIRIQLRKDASDPPQLAFSMGMSLVPKDR